MFFGTRVLVGQPPFNVASGNTTWQTNENSILLTTLEGGRASSTLKHASRNWRIQEFVRLISSRLDRSSQCCYRIRDRRSHFWARRHTTLRTERLRPNITKIAANFWTMWCATHHQCFLRDPEGSAFCTSRTLRRHPEAP